MFKRYTFFFIAVLFGVTLSSCSEQYVCTCSDRSTFTEEHPTQEEAEKWCSGKEGPKVTCELGG